MAGDLGRPSGGLASEIAALIFFEDECQFANAATTQKFA
jgi:hypothetical protein